MRKVSLDVRQFALPCPRRGSIELHSGYGAPPMSGQEIHMAIQRRRQREFDDYTPEKKMSWVFEAGPYEFHISGRADGITENPVQIEEIKTAFDVEELWRKLRSDDNHPYIWQLRTYGYFHYKETGRIPFLNLHLVSSRNFKSMDLRVELDIAHYELWLALRLDELVEETKVKEKLFKARQKMAEEMSFPFATPRPGQRELIEGIEAQVADEHPLLVQAPTGLGKTVGVLYPNLKDSLSRGQKTVYVTPKNSQHIVAEEAVEKLQEQGSKIRSLTLTAKSKMCLKAETLCNPGYCEFARDYYTKLAEHDLVNKLSKKRKLTQEKLVEMGKEFEVCPFELSVEAIERADVVIGDYNYAFAPRSLLGRLSEPLLEAGEKPNLVIDEAHNLPSRAQDYFSPSLSVQELDILEGDFTKLPPTFSLQAGSLIRKAKSLIQEYGEDGGSRKVDIDIEPFLEHERSIRALTTEYLDSDTEIITRDPMLRLMNLWSEFIAALEYRGPEFFTTYQNSRFTEMLKVTCCDASEQLKIAYKQFKNVVAFSATLKPFTYYQELLGFDLEKSKTLEFQSPFKPENRQLMIIPQISTKLSDRVVSSGKVAEVISRVTRVKAGNYIALFPSFEFLAQVEKQLQVPHLRVLRQERDMKQLDVQIYLEELKAANEPILLLGVQGGVFSEGVDFPGDMLIGAFVIGPALPSFDFEREQIRTYFDGRYGKENGFNYTYVYPAMAKAIQSAGRVIRSETDKGVIILMDSRFLNPVYAEAMPQGWFKESPRELVSQKILADLETFWKNSDTPCS
ncbi:ATP-dependent DNA helicase [Bdellovibrio bacteriovorus]|uniref:Similar to ATP dependent helicase n=1 Tax=Bdellovibrio bacteriovorus (strain ATCC 15356 / DSM 50701 / NCIMB 9529 / HD100) TaxID=264462 RepID=Q6MR44_BDEBA|nr:ATP-dependent DNA helicase [Bdellovibrio bacteriovorus]CAE77914.1 similar to ATP dependent helicase [Bdellovibrio bacteriovorus HD100]